MVDFRSRNEIANAQAQQSRALEVAKDKHLRQLEAQSAELQHRVTVTEEKMLDLVKSMGETKAQFSSDLSALNDDISRVHSMIRSGAESDLEMIEQMNRNNERRIDGILKLIKDI